MHHSQSSLVVRIIRLLSFSLKSNGRKSELIPKLLLFTTKHIYGNNVKISRNLFLDNVKT